MKPFQSELGQAAFGQKPQFFECPHIVLCVLESLSQMWGVMKTPDKHGGQGNPFDNSGGKFKCETFEVEAYSWDDEYNQPYNFKWRDVEISWYKYFGRSTTINRAVSIKEATVMMLECCRAFLDYLEKENAES
jgi:hypothetical protein